MARVTEKEILQMNRLYQILGTYAAVGREVGRAPSTVKRYIDPNFSENESITLKQIDWNRLKKNGNHRERPFYLLERPNAPGSYIISNHFDEIQGAPLCPGSYQVLEAELMGMSFEEFVKFCQECLGAKHVVLYGSRYGSLYFSKTDNVEKFVEIMNDNY